MTKDVQDEGLAAVRGAVSSIKELALALGLSPSAVSQWDRVPADRVLAVSQITGVPRSRIRPDLYPPPRRAS